MPGLDQRLPEPALPGAKRRIRAHVHHEQLCGIPVPEHAAVWLGVWENNEAGQSFYRKWGFDAVGTKEFVVGDDAQTDIVMVRSTAG